jgi:Flp pilus assembly protein TadG
LVPAPGDLMLTFRNATRETARKFSADTEGVAAVEFALIAGFLLVGLLNTVDLATYAFQRMQVENAAQMGAQAAWKACDLADLPATRKCDALDDAIARGIQQTALGNAVELQGSPSEGYYCVDESNALVRVSDVSSKPTDCSSTGAPGVKPGDYIVVTVTFTYTPVFGVFSAASLLTPTVTQTATMRLG